jgi:hypothetical protein
MKKALKVTTIVFVALLIGFIISKYFPSQTCIQVLVSATNRITGEEKVFGEPCSVPFWYKDMKDYNPELDSEESDIVPS